MWQSHRVAEGRGTGGHSRGSLEGLEVGVLAVGWPQVETPEHGRFTLGPYSKRMETAVRTSEGDWGSGRVQSDGPSLEMLAVELALGLEDSTQVNSAKREVRALHVKN